MNVEYAGVMRRFSSHGWVSNWDDSRPNVWLTAWVIRIFSHVSFQDWEDYIYIDPLVVGSAVMWLINYQTDEGEFLADTLCIVIDQTPISTFCSIVDLSENHLSYINK